MAKTIFKTTVKVEKPYGSNSQWTECTKDKIVKFEDAIQKRTKASVVEFLGSGSRGIAFALSNGNVLKLTDDKTEASASAVLKGRKLKNIIEIYDVFQLGKLPIYGVVQEKVKPLSDKFEQLCNEIFAFWCSTDSRENAIKSNSVDKTLDSFRTALSYVNLKLSKLAGGTVLAKQLLNGLLELAANNIAFIDVVYRNVGKTSDGVVKIFDIGYSKGPKASIPAIKEAKQFTGFKLWVERIITNG